MSVEQAKACVERMKTDEAFRARVMATEDVPGRMELIKAEGFDCSAEDILSLQELGEVELDEVVAAGFLACGAAAPCGVAAPCTSELEGPNLII